MPTPRSSGSRKRTATSSASLSSTRAKASKHGSASRRSSSASKSSRAGGTGRGRSNGASKRKRSSSSRGRSTKSSTATRSSRHSATRHTRRRSRRTSRGFRAFATAGILAAIAASVAFVLRYLGILYVPLPQIFEQRATYSASLPDSSLTYTNPYDWSHLSVGSNGRYHYTMGGQEVSRTGVDVSEHQGSIDWKAVKADGIGFAYVRVGYRGSDTGVIIGDAQFKANIQGAQAAGLQLGAYFYSEAISVEEARAEAQYVLTELGSTPLDYPIAFDYEPTGNDRDRIAGLSNDQMAAIAHAFCDAIQEGGRSAIVYGNASDLARMNAPTLYQYGFWYASYTTLPSADVAFGIWQYSSQGSVAGIGTLVDMDMDLTQPLATYLQKQNG